MYHLLSFFFLLLDLRLSTIQKPDTASLLRSISNLSKATVISLLFITLEVVKVLRFYGLSSGNTHEKEAQNAPSPKYKKQSMSITGLS